MRKHKPKYKGIRPKKLQPDIDPEIDSLVKKWNRSADRKRFEQRFKKKA